MTELPGSQSGPSHKALEMVMALLIGAFGLVVIFGSVKAGINWGAEGPRAGFFPFYVGAAIVAASVINFWHARRDEDGRRLFAEWSQLRQVMSVVVPTAIYVVAIIYVGIYVATAVFVSVFMVWLGRYRVVVAVALGVGIAVALFLTFEVWFLVPLPKGPLETLLGY
jgi:hypothetical protein